MHRYCGEVSVERLLHMKLKKGHRCAEVMHFFSVFIANTKKKKSINPFKEYKLKGRFTILPICLKTKVQCLS